jgi:hypothetical protein
MVPARRSSEPTARRRARRIVGVLFLAAGLSIAAVFLSLSGGDTRTDLSAVDPRGRELASAAAVDYLAGGSQTVPHAASLDPEQLAKVPADLASGQGGVPLSYRSLNWIGFTPQRFGSEETGFTAFEVHHFLVALSGPAGGTTPQPSPGAGNRQEAASPRPTPSASPSGSPTPGNTTAPTTGATPTPTASSPATTPPATAAPPGDDVQAPASNMLQLDVPVLLSEQGPRLAAAPAFAAWKGGAGSPEGTGDYTNYNRLLTEVSDPAKNQIAAWARAYATGDSNTLLTLTGDQDGSHYYLGLSGFTLPDSPSAVQIQSAIRVSGGRLIVRVRVLLARAVPGGTVAGEKARDGGSSHQFVSYADFDLLVGAPAGAQPPVLAWGPAGSAAELEPYHNALTKP